VRLFAPATWLFQGWRFYLPIFSTPPECFTFRLQPDWSCLSFLSASIAFIISKSISHKQYRPQIEMPIRQSCRNFSPAKRPTETGSRIWMMLSKNPPHCIANPPITAQLLLIFTIYNPFSVIHLWDSLISLNFCRHIFMIAAK
jgi:hypothetical protein